MLQHLRREIVLHHLYFSLIFLFLIVGLIIHFTSDNITVLLTLVDIRSSVFDQLFLTATMMGEPLSYLAAILLYLWRNYFKALVILFTGFCSVIASTILKYIFSHPRPVLVFEDLGIWQDLPIVDASNIDIAFNSFPSGHTFAAFSLFTMLILLTKPRKWIAVLCFMLALLVAISRMYLLHHFLKDTLLGAVGGAILALAIKIFSDFLLRENERIKQLYNSGVKTMFE